MCGSMVDIQSPTAEKKRRKIEITGQKYNWSALLHRATIIITMIQRHRVKWHGHVLRKDENWVKKCMDFEVESVRPRDRLKKTWTEVIEKDCQTRQICKEDAMGRRK